MGGRQGAWSCVFLLRQRRRLMAVVGAVVALRRASCTGSWAIFQQLHGQACEKLRRTRCEDGWSGDWWGRRESKGKTNGRPKAQARL